MKKNGPVSRRQFLKLGLMGVSAATLASCGRNTPTPTPAPTAAPEPSPTLAQPTQTPTITPSPVPTPTHTPEPTIEIITAGWPVDIRGDEETRADPVLKAQRDALNMWLRDHPDVKITKIDLNIWDPQAMPGVISSGAGPTFLFGPCVGGGWSREHAAAAYNQGLLADTTVCIEANQLPERTRPNLWQNWSAHSRVGDAFFAYPLDEFTPGVNVFVFRKDILSDLEIDIPQLGWTWLEMAKTIRRASNSSKSRYGLVGSDSLLRDILSFFGADILTEIPAPENNWHWVADWSDPRWIEIIQEYRDLVHKDRAIFSDANIGGDAEVINLLAQGKAVFGRLNYRAMFSSPSEPGSLAAAADKLGKPFGDVFSIVTLPAGDGYRPGGDMLWGPVSFNPNQTAEQLAAGASLLDWMYFGGGLDVVKAAAWKAGNDPRAMFSSFLYMSGRERYEGIPAKPDEVWGDDLVDRWRRVAELPVEPRKEAFFSAETNAGPGKRISVDWLYAMGTDPKAGPELSSSLNESEQDWNRVAEDYVSSMSPEAFKSAAQAYYAALDEFFRSNQTEFYTRRFRPFYENKVLPALA